MTGPEMEHPIEFLLEHHARVSGEIQQLSAEIQQLTEVQREQGRNLGKLSETVGIMAVEMREGFNNLIVANEVTRELAQKAAELAIPTGQRVTKLEQR